VLNRIARARPFLSIDSRFAVWSHRAFDLVVHGRADPDDAGKGQQRRSCQGYWQQGVERPGA
jgi:hypothetical protein